MNNISRIVRIFNRPKVYRNISKKNRNFKSIRKNFSL